MVVGRFPAVVITVTAAIVIGAQESPAMTKRLFLDRILFFQPWLVHKKARQWQNDYFLTESYFSNLDWCTRKPGNDKTTISWPNLIFRTLIGAQESPAMTKRLFLDRILFSQPWLVHKKARQWQNDYFMTESYFSNLDWCTRKPGNDKTTISWPNLTFPTFFVWIENRQ